MGFLTATGIILTATGLIGGNIIFFGVMAFFIGYAYVYLRDLDKRRKNPGRL